MKLRQASRAYNVPYGTLHNKVHSKHTGKSGGQLRLSAEAEKRLVKTIDLLSTCLTVLFSKCS